MPRPRPQPPPLLPLLLLLLLLLLAGPASSAPTPTPASAPTAAASPKAKSAILQRREREWAVSAVGRFYFLFFFGLLFVPPLVLALRDLWLDPATPLLASILWQRLKEVSYGGSTQGEGGELFLERLLAAARRRRSEQLRREEEGEIDRAEADAKEEAEERAEAAAASAASGTAAAGSGASAQGEAVSRSARNWLFDRSSLLRTLRQRNKAEADAAAAEAAGLTPEEAAAAKAAVDSESFFNRFFGLRRE